VVYIQEKRTAEINCSWEQSSVGIAVSLFSEED
jgi:hypothetical protein